MNRENIDIAREPQESDHKEELFDTYVLLPDETPYIPSAMKNWVGLSKDEIDHREKEWMESNKNRSLARLAREKIEVHFKTAKKRMTDAESRLQTMDNATQQHDEKMIARMKNVLDREEEIRAAVGKWTDSAIALVFAESGISIEHSELLEYAVHESGSVEEFLGQMESLIECSSLLEEMCDVHKDPDWQPYDKAVTEESRCLTVMQWKAIRSTLGGTATEHFVKGEASQIFFPSPEDISGGMISVLGEIAQRYPEMRPEAERLMRKAFDGFFGDALTDFYGHQFGDDRWEVKNELFRNLAENHSEGVIDFFRDWLQKYDGVFLDVNDILDAVKHSPPSRVAQTFLPELRSARPAIRRAAEYILYQLEFGNIGVSEDGVKYLDKIFDLGTYNDPDNVVRRISNRGEMGIFVPRATESGYTEPNTTGYALESAFTLEGLANDQERIRADVLAFTADSLFTPRPNETEGDQREREKVAQEFLQNYYRLAQDEIFRSSGTYLQNHTLPEQVAFFRYYHHADATEKSRVGEFLHEFDGGGLKCFLAWEEGPRHGERLLALAERLPKPLAHRVFEGYAHIADTTGFLVEALKDLLSEETNWTPEDRAQLIEKLLRGADALLQRVDAQSQQGELPEEKIAAALEDAEVEPLLFAGTFHNLARDGRAVTIEDYRHAKFEILPASALSIDDQKDIMHIAQRNYPHDMREKILNGIQRSFENDGTRYYMVRYSEKLIGYMRFDDLPNDRVYAGSLNIRTGVRGSSFGETILGRGLEQQARTHVVEAKAHPDLKFAQRYIGEFGFVVTKLLENDEGYGKTYFHLEIDSKRNAELLFGHASFEDIQTAYKNQPDRDASESFKISRYTLPQESNHMLSDATALLSNGEFIISAYRKDPKNPNDLYVVFEKDPLKLDAREVSVGDLPKAA